MNAAVKIKICGLTRPEDCRAVCAAGADYAGFVFAPSRRQVDAGQARQLIGLLSPPIRPVGVFGTEKPEEIARLAQSGRLQVIQLHSRFVPGRISRLRQLLGPETAIWQLLPVLLNQPAAAALAAAGATLACCLDAAGKADQREMPDVWLLDSARNGLAGGTGTPFDWAVFREFCQDNPVILAGGLNSANVSAALCSLQLAGVDCSSGAETDGLKDPAKINAFCVAVRAFSRQTCPGQATGGYHHETDR